MWVICLEAAKLEGIDDRLAVEFLGQRISNFSNLQAVRVSGEIFFAWDDVQLDADVLKKSRVSSSPLHVWVVGLTDLAGPSMEVATKGARSEAILVLLMAWCVWNSMVFNNNREKSIGKIVDEIKDYARLCQASAKNLASLVDGTSREQSM
jgi:hypothetical protein